MLRTEKDEIVVCASHLDISINKCVGDRLRSSSAKDLVG
jgi:hypothetical protein